MRPPKPKLRFHYCNPTTYKQLPTDSDTDPATGPLGPRLDASVSQPHQSAPNRSSSGSAPSEPPGTDAAKGLTNTTNPAFVPPRPPSQREAHRARLQEDELGKLIDYYVAAVESIGWPQLLQTLRGRGDLRISARALKRHPAASYLRRLARHGAPAVLKSKPWSHSTLKQRIARGSHKSCQDHLDFLREELLDFMKKGFWLVLPWKTVRALQDLGHLIGLRVSPMGVVPQRNRRPRLIVDLSFYDVNADTINLAPKEAMQFGRALERILYQIRHANPRFGPIYLSKVDLSDGFYRVKLNDSAIAKLAVALPRFPGEDQLIALPLVLPMGWVESPPYFCAVTETVADLVNQWPPHIQPEPHPLEEVSQTPPPPEEEPPTAPITAPDPSLAPAPPAAPDLLVAPALLAKPVPPVPPACPSLPEPLLGPPGLVPSLPPARSPTPPGLGPVSQPPARPGTQPDSRPAAQPPVLRPFSKPVRFTDIYVDDFIQGLQGPPHVRLAYLRRLLHCIDAVFRPVDSLDSPLRKQVPSLKKMLAGDSHLSTRKVVLGWVLDTVTQTLELPPHRIQRLQDIFESLRGKTRVPVKLWHKVLGELRSVSIGIPGSRGLFSLLQEGLRHTDRHRIRITPEMRDQLDDFEHLAATVQSRPTELAEIVPDHPIALGPHDASGTGMGGAWLPATTDSNLSPIIWRAKFPTHIQERLVSYSNPHGDITNSDLEMAGLLAQQDILAQQVNCRGRTMLPLGDNTPMVSWHHKQSTTTTGPAAYLLRLNSIHQRHYRYVSKSGYIPGSANAMADDCSRLWHLTDSQLLAHFNSTYPQAQPWQIVQLRPEMLSSLISALQRQRPALDSLLSRPPTKTPIGPNGKPLFPRSTAWTPTSTASNHTSTFLFSKYLPTDYDTANLPPAGDLSSLNVFRHTYGPSPRKSVWGPNGV